MRGAGCDQREDTGLVYQRFIKFEQHVAGARAHPRTEHTLGCRHVSQFRAPLMQRASVQAQPSRAAPQDPNGVCLVHALAA
jgi:hypothetical protein